LLNGALSSFISFISQKETLSLLRAKKIGIFIATAIGLREKVT
jgi:hypothetical protein